MTLPENRWLFPKWPYEKLNEKSVYATFGIEDGVRYEGKGKVRVRENPESLQVIELVFTRKDSPSSCTDIAFILSPRQFPNLEKGQEGEESDFYYTGLLTPDNDPN